MSISAQIKQPRSLMEWISLMIGFGGGLASILVGLTLTVSVLLSVLKPDDPLFFPYFGFALVCMGLAAGVFFIALAQILQYLRRITHSLERQSS